MSSFNSISPKSSRVSSAAAMPRAHRCADRRGLRRRSALHSRFRAPPSHDAVATWASAIRGSSAVVICHKGSKLSQGVAAWLRHAGATPKFWMAASRPGCEAGSAGPAKKAAPARCARAHGLGHPGAAENRSHRLSLADPPLRRSRRRLPVRRAVGSQPSRNVSAARRSTSKASSGVIAARPAPST